jgi:hypothetical protein
MRPLEVGLRTIFRDPNLSIAGTYTSPSGDAKTVRVIYVEAYDAVVGGGATMATLAQQEAAEMLQSEVPVKPAKGATLAFGGRTYSIRSGASPSKRGLTWRVVLAGG